VTAEPPSKLPDHLAGQRAVRPAGERVPEPCAISPRPKPPPLLAWSSSSAFSRPTLSGDEIELAAVAAAEGGGAATMRVGHAAVTKPDAQPFPA
jgi:hypothetical protein